MEEILKLLHQFEERNNLSAFVNIYSDGSFGVQEFWNEDMLFGGSFEELKTFLNDTQYKLGEDGRCISPVQIIQS